MSEIERYDAVVLGTGEAGKYMAWHLGASGKRTVVIERKFIGGNCPNVACLPSKNVIQSAKVASYFQRGKEFGVLTDKWAVSMPGVRARKRQMVEGLHQMHMDNFARSKAEIVMGEGRFIGDRTLKVSLAGGGERILRGDQVFINTGTRASIGNTPGLAEASPLTHIEALELDVVPEHLLILGGGFVGLEFAQAMRRLGSRVTIVERNDRLLHNEDLDVSEAITQLFQDEGIVTVANTSLGRVEGKSGQGVRLYGSRRQSQIIVEGSHLLVATGRIPNTDGIGLDLAGVKTTKKGFVDVNERLETSAPGVWALGDCAGSPLFTHISFDDFRIVRDNLGGGRRTTTGRQVPSCLFTDPELAHVGLDESQAKQQGIAYRLAKIPMAAVLRTRAMSETRGFLKVLVAATDDQILGFTGFGEGAGEIMATVQLAIRAAIPYTVLRDMTITHPTLAEGIVALLSKVPAIK
jgi:pyruvate/2-oxoglutarate dehydrogenase complex dihydrolipoamide dehydrogenase (E3) component